MRYNLPCVLLVLLLTQLAHARAPAPSLSLSVLRDETATSCPDESWFKARILAHAGGGGRSGDFEIQLSHQQDGWQAVITLRARSDSRASERVLRDRSPECTPLAEAAALTVAIIASDFARRAEAQPEPPPEPIPPDRDRAEPVIPPAPDESSTVWVGVGGGASLGWIAPSAPLLGFSVALDSVMWRHGIRLMLTTEQQFSLDPGRIVVQAWLATAFSCVQLSENRLSAALCATLDGGLLRASAEGFEDGKSTARSYGAVGLEAQPSFRLSDTHRISAALGALLPVQRESFSVEGRGTAYLPPSTNWRVLGFFELGGF